MFRSYKVLKYMNSYMNSYTARRRDCASTGLGKMRLLLAKRSPTSHAATSGAAESKPPTLVQKRRHWVRIACLMKKGGPEGTLARGLH